MQAVIIAAGESSRFWPLNQGHKSQLKLLGKPIIAWTIKGLVENNITDIIVVHGAASTIPAELGDGKDLGCTIFYVLQEQPLGTGNALLCAARFLLCGRARRIQRPWWKKCF